MFEDFHEIWVTIKKNKLRTFLTGFSMAWGLFMLIALLGAGNGIRNGISFNFGSSAMNTAEIWPYETSMPFDGLQKGRPIKLDQEDAPYIEGNFPEVSAATPLITLRVTVNNKAESVTGQLLGVMPNDPALEAIKVYPGNGRLINRTDIARWRKVVAIHARTARLLFGDKPALGQYVSIDRVMYQVVGVYNDDDMSQSPPFYMPLSTAKRIYNPQEGYSQVNLRLEGLKTSKENEAFEEALQGSLARKHRYDPSDSNAIMIYNAWSEYIQFQGIFNALTAFLWIIGIGTLIAGVVGISNIMLITVKERTREFGIRKALGAHPRSILKLVLTECLCITAFFGYIGMLLGIGVTELVNYLMGPTQAPVSQEELVLFSNPTVNPGIILAATGVLILAGLAAGYFPARKAVRVKPIEALRYE